MLFSLQHLATSCYKIHFLLQIRGFCNINLCMLQNNLAPMCLYISKLWRLFCLLRLLRPKMCLMRVRFIIYFSLCDMNLRNTILVSYCRFMNKMKIFITSLSSLNYVRACSCSKKIKIFYPFFSLMCGLVQ